MEKVRFGIIGINGVGEYHANLVLKNPNAELTAISDIDSESLDENASKLGVNGFRNYKELINTNSIDAVIICTPHNLHAEMTIDCLDAGLHVLLEKPLANTVAEADRIIGKVKEKNLKVSVGHQYRTHRSSQITKSIIESGEIGKIMRVLWSWNSFRPELYYSQKPWHGTWEESGAGVLMNQVSHDLDLICWLFGDATEVNAIIGNQLHSEEIEDIVCANILFENGAHGSFQFSINQPQAFSVRQIVGDKGAIFINDVKSLTNDMDDEITLCTYEDDVNKLVETKWNPSIHLETAKLEDLKKKPQYKRLRKRIKAKIANKISNIKKILTPPVKPVWFNYQKPFGREALVNNFIDSIIYDKKPEIDAESSLKTVELINAIILSAIKKKNVSLPIDRAEYDQLFNKLKTGEIKVPRFRN